ncbi:hypothetical protein PRIPAC_87946 [Pristionchus pacificus]|uniref:Uncharacterized protein n=1 Tax=Pristionchus pacificus TaxID=54126 RepID=A0A2A6CW39_PRIPA|nr:hypothetical protein PRIPAC_87946 [Pristionchus pacificus]|eukprot:PDM82348.1 hypothetical protein PRIPAC_36741 [Pristionchus pacificus]
MAPSSVHMVSRRPGRGGKWKDKVRQSISLISEDVGIDALVLLEAVADDAEDLKGRPRARLWVLQKERKITHKIFSDQGKTEMEGNLVRIAERQAFATQERAQTAPHAALVVRLKLTCGRWKGGGCVVVGRNPKGACGGGDAPAAGRAVPVRCRRHWWWAEGRREEAAMVSKYRELLLLLRLLRALPLFLLPISQFKPIRAGFGSGMGRPGCLFLVKAPPTVIRCEQLIGWELGAEGRLHGLREA